MLENHEFDEFAAAYNKCVRNVKDYRAETGNSLADSPLEELYSPALDKYEQLTGFRPKDGFHAYRKHRVERYGDPCSKCGEYFLAPRTQTCPECGQKHT